MKEVEEEFNSKYNEVFGPDAFDKLIPPIPVPGVPDGFAVFELLNLRGVFDANVTQFFGILQHAWNNMPSNQFCPYHIPTVVKECDADTLPCQTGDCGIVSNTKCCNPPIPAFGVHGFDSKTTPVTGKLVPFADLIEWNGVFDSVESKRVGLEQFRSKIKELDSRMFVGGAANRWLDTKDPHLKFEMRKLDGQNYPGEDANPSSSPYDSSNPLPSGNLRHQEVEANSSYLEEDNTLSPSNFVRDGARARIASYQKSSKSDKSTKKGKSSKGSKKSKKSKSSKSPKKSKKGKKGKSKKGKGKK